MTRTLRLTIFASLIFHLSLAAWFLVRGREAGPLRRGSIAVEFIQSVPHGSVADPHNHPGRKVLPRTPPEDTAETSKRAESANARPVTGPRSASPRSAAPGDQGSSARESDRYILAVTQLINARKIYPRAAVEREEEGRVVVGITLDREGHVIESVLEESAPFDSLNRAALDTIKSIVNFPPIPPEVADPIHLHVPLVFRIERR